MSDDYEKMKFKTEVKKNGVSGQMKCHGNSFEDQLKLIAVTLI